MRPTTRTVRDTLLVALALLLAIFLAPLLARAATAPPPEPRTPYTTRALLTRVEAWVAETHPNETPYEGQCVVHQPDLLYACGVNTVRSPDGYQLTHYLAAGRYSAAIRANQLVGGRALVFVGTKPSITYKGGVVFGVYTETLFPDYPSTTDDRTARRRRAYPNSTVFRAAKAWTRKMLPAETIHGGLCSRDHADYTCYVDVWSPDDQAFESHAFMRCVFSPRIRSHRYRDYPATAWIVVRRSGAAKGGVRCEFDTAFISTQRAHKSPYRGTGAGR